ncbi:MAG: hypothetical protein WAM88_01975 [Nitrososphaeraceae archaeon]
MSFDRPLSLETKNRSIPSVMRSIFLSNNESVLAAASRLSPRVFLATIAAAEVEEVLPCPIFTSSFASSSQLYKIVFNTLLPLL